MLNSNHDIDTKTADRLKSKLTNAQGLARIRMLIELASALVDSKPAMAKKYATAALKEIGDSDYSEEKAFSDPTIRKGFQFSG